MQLTADAKWTDGRLVVQLSGNIDGETSRDLEDRCEKWIAQKPSVMIFDLAGVPYISSAGLYSVLLAGKQLDAAGGRLLLCGLKGTVKKVFQFAGFAAIFAIFETLDEALADGQDERRPS